MALQPLVIYYLSTTRTLNSYTVAGINGTYARTLVVNRGGTGFITRGDELREPEPFTVTAWLEGTNHLLSEAYAEAYEVVEEAESADRVRTHWHDVLVDGILGYSMRPDGTMVALTLNFARTGPTVEAIS